MRGITFKVVVEKGSPQTDSAPPRANKAPSRNRHISTRLKKIGLLAATIILIAGLLFLGWRVYQQLKVKSMDPFTAHTHSLVSFPLYYPTKLPSSYHIEKTSVSNPDTGVIVFTITDTDSEHFIYVSEEAKPKSFNFQGYYLAFSERKSVNTPFGTATMGIVSINRGGRVEVGSLTSNKTWLIINTNTNLPFSKIQTMLTSLTISRY
jgi:hypothetical protein